MSHIVVVGSLNMDLVVRVPHMPAPGETLLGDNFQTIPGGKGANQAVAAARMGARVTMIGCVGDDDFGKNLVDNLEIEGIDITNISVDPDAATGIALITVDESGQNSIVVASGANMALTPDDVRAAWQNLTDVDVVVMPLEVSLACIEEAATLAKQSTAKVVLNPAPAQELSDQLLGKIDVLVPNESETTLLTGLDINSPDQAKIAAQKLQSKGVNTVILTLGERGAMLIEEGAEAQLYPSFPTDVVDTTAAGDAFVATLSVGISSGVPLEEAIRQANAAGALAVSKIGAQPSLPTKSEIRKFIKNQRGEL